MSSIVRVLVREGCTISDTCAWLRVPPGLHLQYTSAKLSSEGRKVVEIGQCVNATQNALSSPPNRQQHKFEIYIQYS